MNKLVIVLLTTLMILQPIKPEDLENIKEGGTYPVELTTTFNGETKTEVIMITIQAPKTIIKNKLGIDARDFSIPLSDLKRKDAKQLMALSNAHAWDTTTGEPIPITAIEIHDFQPETGVYKVIFKTSTISISVYAMTQNVLQLKDGITYIFPRAFWREQTLTQLVGIVFVFLIIPVILFLIYLLYTVRQMIQVKQTLYSKVKNKGEIDT